jgi:hypothetical protein
MCRTKENRPRNIENRPSNERIDDFDGLFAAPAPSIDELSADPMVRVRLGEWISLAMNRATHARHRRR